MDSIDVKTLNVNESTQNEKDLEFYETSGSKKNWPQTPFPINDNINKRVILYDGDLELLRADAIVNPTNENLTKLELVSKLAGPELENHIRKRVKLCATGDVRLTPGFRSNFKYIIHAVPPKYQPKYKTAAETSLFHTYFRILETMIDRKLKTVIMPILATTKCNLPVEENFHMQLRIIRRILEKKLKEFDKIVVHVENAEQLAGTFFSYFPHSSIDEKLACYRLSPSIGGSNGEPIIPEREIRIKGKPASLDKNDCSVDLTSGLDLSTVVGRNQFSKMQEDLEVLRKTSKGNISVKSQNQVAIRRSVFQGCVLL